MSRSGLDLAGWLAQGWARTYTFAMAAELQRSRRREIASDVWEHREAALSAGRGPLGTNAEVLWRLVRGMPADLLWRMQRGGFEMNITFGLERTTGVLMLLLVLLLFASLFGASGVGSDEPYFTDDFPGYAHNLADDTRGLVFRFALAPVIIVGATLLFLTFRRESPQWAAAGSVLLVIAGVLMLAAAVAGVRLHTLAEVWVAGGAVPRDTTWFTARDSVTYVEGFGFGSAAMLALSFLAFGGAVTRARLAPRWMGRFALAAAGVALVGFAGIAATIDAFWFVMILGMFFILVTFVLMGGWLVIKGSGPTA